MPSREAPWSAHNREKVTKPPICYYRDSLVTLAALKDLGWIVNMDAAEDYRLLNFWSSAAAAVDSRVRWLNLVW